MIPDLFGGQPIIIHGRYTDPGEDSVVIRGRYNGAAWSQKIPVYLPMEHTENDVLAPLWARSRIGTLMTRMYREHRPDIVEEITSLAIEFRLMSQYTAFIAVTDEVRRDPDGTLRSVRIPVEMPEMVDYEGVFGAAQECKKMGVMTRSLHALGYSSGHKMKAPAPSPGKEASINKSPMERVCSEPVFPRDHKPKDRDECDIYMSEDKKDERKTTIVLRLRMTSGRINRQDINNWIQEILPEIREMFIRENSGRIVCLIKLNESGELLKVEILKNTGSDPRVEKELKRIVSENMRMNSGPGEFVIEVIIS